MHEAVVGHDVAVLFVILETFFPIVLSLVLPSFYDNSSLNAFCLVVCRNNLVHPDYNSSHGPVL